MSLEVPVTEFPFPGELAICAGNKPVKECNVAEDLKNGTVLPEIRQYRSNLQAVTELENDLIYPSYQAYFPLGCVACKMMCEAVYELRNGERMSDQPAVFSVEPDTYNRIRAPALESLKRRVGP